MGSMCQGAGRWLEKADLQELAGEREAHVIGDLPGDIPHPELCSIHHVQKALLCSPMNVEVPARITEIDPFGVGGQMAERRVGVNQEAVQTDAGRWGKGR